MDTTIENDLDLTSVEDCTDVATRKNVCPASDKDPSAYSETVGHSCSDMTNESNKQEISGHLNASNTALIDAPNEVLLYERQNLTSFEERDDVTFTTQHVTNVENKMNGTTVEELLFKRQMNLGEIAELKMDLNNATEHMDDIRGKWESTINDNLVQLSREQTALEKISHESNQRWSSIMSDPDRQKALKMLHQQENEIAAIKDEHNFRTDQLKKSMEDLQKSREDLLKEKDELEKSRENLQQAKDRMISEAEEKGRREVIQRVQEVQEIQSKCKKSELLLVAEIDEIQKEKSELVKQLQALKRNHVDNCKSRIADLEAELSKRNKYERFLEEWVRQLRQTIDRLSRFDGRNYDEYRQIIANRQREDDALNKESDAIKRQFLKKKGQLLIATLIWAQKAIYRTPDNCTYKDNLKRIDIDLATKNEAIQQDVVNGNDNSLTETIAWVKERVSEVVGECNHKNDFRRIRETLQDALWGKFEGIQTDMEYKGDHVVNQPQAQPLAGAVAAGLVAGISEPGSVLFRWMFR